MLTPLNFQKGFLVDEAWMAGVSQDPEQTESFVAFIIEHTTGEYVGAQRFSQLSEALDALNQLPRSWAFEKIGGCGSGACGEGDCGTSSCPGKCSQGAC